MITLIFGENAYERDSQLDKLISQSFDRYDGLDINTNQLSQMYLCSIQVILVLSII